MAIIGIIAIAQNFAIGRGGKLPWHYSADLKFFKQTTSGNAVVMGFNTWRSIGKPLPNRLNIVLSRRENIESKPNVILMRSSDEVIALLKYLSCDVFIIGGAKTFDAFSNQIEKWIITEVPLDVEDADTFMPRDFLDGFQLAETKDIGEDLNVKFLHRK